jgi:hypothetical protein
VHAVLLGVLAKQASIFLQMATWVHAHSDKRQSFSDKQKIGEWGPIKKPLTQCASGLVEVLGGVLNATENPSDEGSEA